MCQKIIGKVQPRHVDLYIRQVQARHVSCASYLMDFVHVYSELVPYGSNSKRSYTSNSKRSTMNPLPLPVPRIGDDRNAQLECTNTSEVNLMLPPTCTCGKVLARMSFIRQYVAQVRSGRDPRDILTSIGLTRSCCRTHFHCGLLTRHC